jgi:hypothetical protein
MYLLLEDGSIDNNMQNLDMIGTFKTSDEAREAIIKDINDIIGDDCELQQGRNENWASTYYICYMAQAVKPIPVVKRKVKVVLEDV